MQLTRRRALAWLVPVLLLAAALRLYGLFELSPPGLSHDEVANWLIVRRIFNGEHSIYFPYAYGHEALFHYVQAIFAGLIGDNALALRLPSAFAGLLGISVTYALNRRLFGRNVALLAAALLAVLFWSVFYSRQALRAISLPLLSGASAYIWWRAWGHRENAPPARSTRDFLLAGLVAGLSLYTYMAARTVPIFYAAFTLYLLLLHWKAFRRRWRGILFFWLLFAVVAVPLVAYLQLNPEAEVRVYEVNEPMRDMFKGNFRPVVDNTVDILAGFGLRGDPLWRQGVPFRTVFHPLLAIFFYGCLLYSFWRVKDARYGFLLLWIFTAFIPSVMTIDAPSTIRMINILPVLTTLPAIVMHSWGKLSTETGRLSTETLRVWFISAVFLAIILFTAVFTARDILITWPGDADDVEFTWQTALRDAAHYLDARALATISADSAGAVAIGGWSPESMDAPTMALYLQREDLTLRHFHPLRAVILPAEATPQQPARLLLPAVLPVHPVLAAELAEWGVQRTVHGRFAQYQLSRQLQPTPGFPASVPFGDELLFLGHSFDGPSCQPASGQPCQVITYWRVLQPPGELRRIFLHALDDQGQVITAGDDLGAPAAYWQPGDLILQRHELAVDTSAIAALQSGLYHPDTGARVPIPGNGDVLPLPKPQFP
ncbi:MAG: glycosyltransferase family 39 protein [Anaerolineae bacterium]|nr:glycosyltransferase family 39 protein [Anaerolineae bacterium]